MSVQDQINRIGGNITNALSAVAEKGVTVPEGSNSDNLADLISEIQTSGEGGTGGSDISLGLTGATVGQIAKITAVDDTGKPTAWEAADMPSGGVVQSDWNQNDDAAPDYVKNRPFYTGDPVETVLVEESTIEFFETDGSYVAEFQSTFSATVGETYKVSWDGSVYECTCVDSNGKLAIGNLSIDGAGSDTGEPFFMQVFNGMGIFIFTADTAASHTISISVLVQEVVKVDEKYLPTIPADKLPAIPADKLPAIPVIEFTTKISENIANGTQPSFTVSNLSYSEIYAIVEKGNFQIKDSAGVNYRPIRTEIGSSGSILVDILVIGTPMTYANLACSADQTRFYRNSWWQIEATKK